MGVELNWFHVSGFRFGKSSKFVLSLSSRDRENRERPAGAVRSAEERKMIRFHRRFRASGRLSLARLLFLSRVTFAREL